MSPGVISYTARDIAELLASSAASVSVVDAGELARLEQAAAAGDELAQKSLATVADATQGVGLVPAMRSSHRPCVGCAEPVPLPDGVALTTLIVIHGPPRHVLAGVVCTECAAQGRDWVLARHLARIQSFLPAPPRLSPNSKESTMFDYGTDLIRPDHQWSMAHFLCQALAGRHSGRCLGTEGRREQCPSRPVERLRPRLAGGHRPAG